MIEKIVIQKLTIAGKEYEYPDTTALVGKINELADAVNVLQESMDLVQSTLVAEPDTPAENVQPDAKSRSENVQKEALTMALEALHAIAHWGPWKDDREEYAEKAHKKICELLTKGGDNE